MKVRATILDFDGVVADSMAIHLEAWAAATVELFGRQLPDPHLLVGYGTRAIAGIIAAKMGDKTVAKALIAAKDRYLAAHSTPLYAGVREVFQALQAGSTPYGIASNSPTSFVKPALAKAGLDVPVVVCADEVRRGKPLPDIFWACANLLGVPPRERPLVVVYEDSLHGIRAAIAAGMTAIGVTTSKSGAYLREAGAITTCASLAEALASGWLENVPTS